MHKLSHLVVYHDPLAWAAVPANNGANGPAWQWGDEILVGFTRGTFSRSDTGHQCDGSRPFASWLARSSDAGETWNPWQPMNYAGCSGLEITRSVALDFTAPGLVLRVEGNGYHGNAGARWFCSWDRAATWHGPYPFAGLLDCPELAGMEFTGRTAYLVHGTQQLDLFVSARRATHDRPQTVAILEKPFVARTEDGGQNWRFVTWIVPWSDPDRAVMPAPVRLSASDLVAAVRRKSGTHNWIDAYASIDNGASWAHRARVGETETGNAYNGNPPALILLGDGRLCCAYGNRSSRRILATFSADGGYTWSHPQVLRDDFHSANGWPDLGYCRLFERSDGSRVVVYFWCTQERPQTHIAATVF